MVPAKVLNMSTLFLAFLSMSKHAAVASTFAFYTLIFSLLIPSKTTLATEAIDRIAAVVEDGVILESELNEQVHTFTTRLQANNTPMPPPDVIRRQLLERIIQTKLQLQLAKRLGIQVDDETLQQSLTEITQQNNLSQQEFKETLKQDNIPYEKFVDEVRTEITLNRLRHSQIVSRIKVSDREVTDYLKTQGKHAEERNAQYHLAHILISTAENSSPTQIQQAREQAQETFQDLKNGSDFKQTAMRISDGPQALSGGDLGWRKLSQIPTLLIDVIAKMRTGDIEGPIRSPSGFHIIKLLDVKGKGKHLITQTQARHILIKTNELVNDDEAQNRLKALKNRILEGDDFATLARANSDDKASALKGGDLGWVSPGALVPQFEKTMAELKIDQLSEPIQTQFGWHIIQVLGREERDNTKEYKKTQARNAIRSRKIEEETELWTRRLRDEAFIENRLEE